jgi:hypothetical protein
MNAPARIGSYEIVRRLGKSMTDVYLAIDKVANRQAALKLIKSNGDMVSKLVVEAERRGAAIQQGLQSVDPRMVEIYDYGDRDGYFYVAMQYVEGRSLAEVLRSEHAMDAIRAATIALEVCEQLAKFHSWQSAVVHGDIKPANIHLGLNNTVRLLDFGIAKTLRPSGDPTVHQFGSPGYCSPERLSDLRIDQQADLWAVGATLYEMLAGQPPYQAEDTRKLEALIRSKRTPRSLPAGVPRALRAIVAKALAPDAARRYRSARDFQTDLQAFLESRTTVAELEARGRWNANATIDAIRRFATRTVRAKRGLRLVTGVSSFAAGMVLYVGGALGYQAWQASRVVPPPLVIEVPRNDDHVKGELALARGYEALGRVGAYTQPEVDLLLEYARDQFEMAAELMPGDAAPQLALGGWASARAGLQPRSPAGEAKAPRGLKPALRRRNRWR